MNALNCVTRIHPNGEVATHTGRQIVISLLDDGGHEVTAYGDTQELFFACMGRSPVEPPIEWVLRTVAKALLVEDAIRPV